MKFTVAERIIKAQWIDNLELLEFGLSVGLYGQLFDKAMDVSTIFTTWSNQIDSDNHPIEVCPIAVMLVSTCLAKVGADKGYLPINEMVEVRKMCDLITELDNGNIEGFILPCIAYIDRKSVV